MKSMRCPICHKPLEKHKSAFSCQNGHSFDIARQGYVNLSRKQKKGGDNEMMSKARTKFLETGAYDFMRSQVCDLVAAKSPDLLIDLGCGEGYYTRKMAEHAGRTYGIDLSVSSLKHAAAADKITQYAAASIFDLPFEDECADMMVSIFTPIPAAEAARVLKKDGILCTVTPGRDHHYELKELMYPQVRLNDPQKPVEGFEKTEQFTLKEKKHVEDVMTLLEMTPYRYKCPADALEKVRNCTEGLDVTFEFVITLWRKL